MGSILFTSESVTEGHPDKLADQISDAVLDAMLAQDPHSRVACETLVTTGLVMIAGEITSKATVDFQEIIRNTVLEIGYHGGDSGFDGKTCGVLVSIDKQSPDIALGVDEETSQSKDQGAGDQGMMFGYACNETPELMPLPIRLSHQMGERMSRLRHEGKIPWLQPDSKTQVTVEYVDGKPVRIDTVVVSTQHSDSVDNDTIHKTIREQVIDPLLPKDLVKGDIKVFINPTGRFVVGGPVGDCGLTGRKIIVDTYGGMGRHGGGAFSGKDPSKVDRSAAYMARYMAKNVVAAGLAEKCEIQLAYAIGVAKPVSIHADTFGTGKLDDDKLSKVVEDTFDCRPAAIIEKLQLRNPIFRKTAAYGHFGREDQGFHWEETDMADELRKKAGI